MLLDRWNAHLVLSKTGNSPNSPNSPNSCHAPISASPLLTLLYPYSLIICYIKTWLNFIWPVQELQLKSPKADSPPFPLETLKMHTIPHSQRISLPYLHATSPTFSPCDRLLRRGFVLEWGPVRHKSLGPGRGVEPFDGRVIG